MMQTTGRQQRGFVLGYALFGLLLISLTIGAAARMNRSSDNGQRMAQSRDEIVQQASLIRSKLIACAIQYPGGNNGLGYRAQFPAAPGTGAVADVLCPGNPSVNKTIWTAADGSFVPRQMSGFSTWSFAHDATSMRISITATGSTSYTTAALTNAALKFGAQASLVGSTLTIVIAG